MKNKSQGFGANERRFVISVVRKFIRNPAAVEDVTQDAMFCAYRHREQFRGQSRFTTWLYQIAVRTSLMYLRSTKRYASETELTHADQAASRSLWNELVARAELDRVSQQLATQSSAVQTAFWLHQGYGYEESEIASALRVPLSTIKSRTYRARLALAA